MDKQIYVKGNVCVDVSEAENGVIAATAEEDKVTSYRLGLEINRFYKFRTFYVWNEGGYSYAYSHPTGKPPSWQEMYRRIN